MRGTSVSELTEAVMQGAIPMDDVYGRRLEVVRPTRADVEALKRIYIDTLVPDARETIQALHEEGVQVRIMSAGVREAVEAVGAELDVSARRIAAVDVHFDEHGAYAGFDSSSPLTRAYGKRELLQFWRRDAPGPFMMVGDGATDLEAAEAADVFVAYAGVVERRPVVSLADVVVRSASLAPILPLALGGEPPRGASRALFEKGLGLLEDEYRSYLPFASNGE